jgi:hypothetical protein
LGPETPSNPLCSIFREAQLIERAVLQDLFDRTATNTDWDIYGPMLWGYFFTHHAREALDAAALTLHSQGYRVVSVHLSDKDHPSDPDLWWLHIEKVEAHSVESLLARNEQLSEFATRSNIASYDGMDVGPAPD